MFLYSIYSGDDEGTGITSAGRGGYEDKCCRDEVGHGVVQGGVGRGVFTARQHSLLCRALY